MNQPHALVARAAAPLAAVPARAHHGVAALGHAGPESREAVRAPLTLSYSIGL